MVTGLDGTQLMKMKFFTLIVTLLAVLDGVQALASSKVTTIAVCTGADCRVDGASDALRELQKQNSGQENIRVTGKPCLGPCGDGPCVMVLDKNDQRIVEPQPDKLPGSLVPPDLFGTNPRGIYQVRTAGQVYQVSQIAQKTAGSTAESPFPEKPDELVVRSTRSLFDRPRNERKVYQRFMQFLVGVGLYQYNEDHGSIGNLQYAIAAILFVGSDVILKEGLFFEIKQRLKKLR